MEPDCICANATMCRTKKLVNFYRSNCDVQANINVAIARFVTDKEIRVLLSQRIVTDQSCYFDPCDGLIVAIVTIGTENHV